jgi:hypothetical protein
MENFIVIINAIAPTAAAIAAGAIAAVEINIIFFLGLFLGVCRNR